MYTSSSRAIIGDECLVDSGSTNTILKDMKFFSELSPAETPISTISGVSNLIKGSGRAHITLSSEIMPPVPKYKHLLGHQKCKRKKLEEEKRKADEVKQNRIHKLFSKETQSSSSNLGDDNVGEDNVKEDEEANVGEDNMNVDVDNVNAGADNVNATVDEELVNPVPDIDIFDPRNWGGLSNDMIKELVIKGPKRDRDVVKGPVDKFGRHFSNTMYTRILSNRETCDREWLVYSKKLDKLYCFCCKLFRTGHPKGGLDDEGYNDWIHASGRLKQHEVGLEHFKNMNEWFELRQRLKCNETIDKSTYEQFRKEKDYWKQVILRIVALVKFLAKYGLAFRGSTEKLYKKGNGNFLGLVEMLEEFDPIMKEHVRRVLNEKCHVHFLGHNIQNELIQLLGDKVRTEIIKKVKQAKYYSIILDCTPDTSHQEQMSIIVRFRTFEVTCKELESLDLDIGDMRGQGYDNGANMRGKNKGVQTRFLEKNPRAFYSACGCHSLNLALCDMANTITKSKEFFGTIQRLYTIFAHSINRWQILKDNVKGLTLKSLSTTRWESRIDSIKPIRTQLGDVRKALREVRETDRDAKIISEAKSLEEYELGDFEFLAQIVIWFELLSKVNVVSKRLQAKDVVLDVAIDEVDKLIKFFKNYREVGFSKALDEAREIANEIGVSAEFRQKRVIYRKKQFDESSSVEEVTFSPEEDFRVNYFLSIVDQAIFSLETRFEQYQKFEKIFGFLFPKKLKTLDEAKIKECCYRLEDALKYEGESDIDAKELCTELNTTYPYAINAYKVLLTIPVTVASAERSFSKLKLLKTYLRSTMSQERLNGLATISIESEILDTMDYKELIESFASKNARRTTLFA
ncbi:zinc finger MYM-type protein 1-like [Helianthus annuus]|uniref:zinc finger MYM-type protein 1-like n=1 Tax=Helianthus annuus TaxID=4232 RepID=UPI001652F30B|nr:zinc finger MYM-type protein 1-like [Helianthus annuus]